MGILLTDEEILKVLDRIPRVKAGDSLIPMVEASAKAQLKKVWVWGHELCPHPEGQIKGYSRLKGFCYECWQALLKEMGE